MKATFDRHNLLKAVEITSQVIPTRSKNRILHHLLLSTSKKGATLSAADAMEFGEVAIDLMGVHIDEPGNVLLPANHIAYLLRECVDQELTIEGDEATVCIQSHNGKFTVTTEDSGKFPEIMKFHWVKHHSIPADQLKQMINQTLFSAASESARYALQGVRWELAGKKIRLVATDGKRMSMVDGEAESANGHETGDAANVVPTKIMMLLYSVLPDRDDPIQVVFDKNTAAFRIGKTEIHAKLVDGRYPSYREVFPQKFSALIPLKVGPFDIALTQASFAVNLEKRGVDLLFGKNKCFLKLRNHGYGSADVEIPIEYSGKEIGILVDPKLILEFLDTLNQETTITLSMVDNKTVAVFTAPGGFTYIIVPLTTGLE